MIEPASNGALVPEYNLRAPTGDDVRAALDRVFGAERSRQLWETACQEAGASPDGVDDEALLPNVIRRLEAQGGAAATVARSVEIRMKTYVRLATRAPASTGGAGQ